MANTDLTTKPDPRIVARIDPYSYVYKYEHHKNKDLSDITELMLRRLFAFDPERFFDLSFDRVKEFDNLVLPFAQKLLKSNVVDYIFKYKLHKKEKLISLLPSLWDTLVKWFGGKIVGSDLKDGSLKNELLYVIEQLSRHHPNYFVDSGLAEDEEFGKFFENIKSIAKLNKSADFILRNNLNKDGANYAAQQIEKKEAEAQIKTAKLCDKNALELVKQLLKIAKEINNTGSTKAVDLINKTIENISRSHKRIAIWGNKC